MAGEEFVVTGGTGWLGSRVVGAFLGQVEDLAAEAPQGARVRALVPANEKPSILTDMGAETVIGDVRDPDACSELMRGCQGATVVHIAGIIHPPGRTRHFEEVNVRGSRNIVTAARAADVKRIVVMSSSSPFGSNPTPTATFDEDSPYNPYMGYGRSKYKMERLVEEELTDGGPERVILRAPWFYGPNQPPRQSLFFSLIRKGKFPSFGAGENRRSMAYVDSVARAILLAARAKKAKGAYWIADARPYPMHEILDTVRTVLHDDYGLKLGPAPRRFPRFIPDIARAADGILQGVGLYHQKIHVLGEMNQTIACRIDKAQRELGYEPLVDLREGMRRSVDWCLQSKIPI